MQLAPQRVWTLRPEALYEALSSCSWALLPPVRPPESEP